MNRIVLLFILSCLAHCFPQESPLILQAKVDKALIKINQPVIYTITLSTDEKFQSQSIPELGSQIVGLRVIDFGQELPKKQDGRYVSNRWYKLQPDIPGSYILPSIKIQYETTDGQTQTASTSEIFIEVEPLGKEDEAANDIRDIKPLVPLPSNFWIYSTALLLLILSAALGFWYYRKRRINVIIASTKPPFLLAIENLKALRNTQPTTAAEFKKFHFALSEILRVYFEEHFQFPATDKTTEEIQKELFHFSLLDDTNKTNFISLMKKTDLIKFTDTSTDLQESLELLESARSFIEKTRPMNNQDSIEPTMQSTHEEDRLL